MMKALSIFSIFANQPEEIIITPEYIIRRAEIIQFDERLGKILEPETPEYSCMILHRGKWANLNSNPKYDLFEVKQFTGQKEGNWKAIPPGVNIESNLPNKTGEEVMQLPGDTLYGESVERFKVIHHCSYSKGNYEEKFRVAKALLPAIFNQYGVGEKELSFLFAGTVPFTQRTFL